MAGRVTTDSAVTHVIAIVFLLILVMGILLIFVPALTGMADLEEKSVYIASEAKAEEVIGSGGLPVQVLALLVHNGDPFHISGQKPPAQGAPVAIRLISPDGKAIYPDASSISGTLYGKTLYLYPNTSGLSESCDYIVSTTRPSGAMRAMTNGQWVVQLIDLDANLLVSSDTRGVITKGTSSIPVSGGSAGGKVYRADCTVMNYTLVNNPGTGFTGSPMNMTYRTFNGVNQYMTIPDDPSLTYTGDLSISMWIRPSTTSGVHQVIGKGKQINANTEDKNYDLYTMDGGKIYFEWDDKVTNKHYHIETDSGPLTASKWNYIVVSVSGSPRRLSVNVNGNPQTVSYFQSNQPGVGKITNPAQIPAVSLKDNAYSLNIAKQSSDIYPFYFKGDIGSFALYNRGLTAGEISSNYQIYRS
jgi:hypothetical protein